MDGPVLKLRIECAVIFLGHAKRVGQPQALVRFLGREAGQKYAAHLFGGEVAAVGNLDDVALPALDDQKAYDAGFVLRVHLQLVYGVLQEIAQYRVGLKDGGGDELRELLYIY